MSTQCWSGCRLNLTRQKHLQCAIHTLKKITSEIFHQLLFLESAWLGLLQTVCICHPIHGSSSSVIADFVDGFTYFRILTPKCCAHTMWENTYKWHPSKEFQISSKAIFPQRSKMFPKSHVFQCDSQVLFLDQKFWSCSTRLVPNWILSILCKVCTFSFMIFCSANR